MSTELEPDLQLEIAHVLFVDIVGYSKLLINEQRESLRRTESESSETPTRFASLKQRKSSFACRPVMEWRWLLPARPMRLSDARYKRARRWSTHPELKVRMGVHSGPVSGMTDVNDRSNVDRRRYQHRAAGDGLRRCRTHSAFKARR